MASRKTQGRSHGLNSLRQYHNLTLLSVINLEPAMYDMLAKLSIAVYEVTECLAFALLYQRFAAFVAA